MTARRTLTDGEVAAVRRWYRRQRIGAWVLLVPAAVSSLGCLALGAMAFGERAWGVGLLFVAAGVGVALIYAAWRRSLAVAGDVSRETPVVRRRGTLRHKRVGRFWRLAIDDRVVEFVDPALHHALASDLPCEVEWIDGTPPLVITARRR